MAGRGLRLGAAGSKELVSLDDTAGSVLSSVMLTRMAEAGLRQAVLTIASHKDDIRIHFGARFDERLALNYVYADASPNTPTSIDAGYEHLRGKVCALGFADILYQPCAGYARALSELDRTGADVMLGLFPTAQPESSDMVAFDASGRVRAIIIKQPTGGRYHYTWSLAVWRPLFTQFLHDWLDDSGDTNRLNSIDRRELFVGDALNAAQAAGLKVHACVVSALGALDAGTPESLAIARSRDWLADLGQ